MFAEEVFFEVKADGIVFLENSIFEVIDITTINYMKIN